jgi:hypothetical protein
MKKTRKISQTSLDALKGLPPGKKFEKALIEAAIELGFWDGSRVTGTMAALAWIEASEEALSWLDANHPGWRGRVIYHIETGAIVG